MIRASEGKTETSAKIGIVSLALFAVVVGLLGGSSRADMVQIIALRPLAALFLIPVIYCWNRAGWRRMRAPLALLGLMALWTLLQLVPLPPALWQALPGREAIVQLDAGLGLEGVWRPISLVPTRGWNALGALAIPGIALLLAAALGARGRVLLLILAGLGALDAMLGILQVSAAADGLYFYAITNKGSPVGIFANENHSGVFSACMMLVIARLGTEKPAWREPAALRVLYAALFLIVLLAALVSGSRAGLLLALFSLVASGVMVLFALPRRRRSGKAGQLVDRIVARPGLIAVVGGALVVGLVAIFLAYDRIPALAGLTEKGAFEDVRFAIFPSLREMVATYWPLGSGFGSFEQVYHIFEPDALLMPAYVNQAHDDWLQFVIEGGTPAVLILLALFAWIVRSLLAIARWPEARTVRLTFWFAILAIICAASLVDYPLRAPAFQLAAVWLLSILALDRREVG